MEEEDIQMSKSRDTVTLKAMIGMANQVKKFLKLTSECIEDGTPIPVLDAQIWIGCPIKQEPWFREKDITEKEKSPGRGHQETN